MLHMEAGSSGPTSAKSRVCRRHAPQILAIATLQCLLFLSATFCTSNQMAVIHLSLLLSPFFLFFLPPFFFPSSPPLPCTPPSPLCTPPCPPFLLFKDRVYSPSWPQTSNAVKDDLELLIFFLSQVLRLQAVYATMPSFVVHGAKPRAFCMPVKSPPKPASSPSPLVGFCASPGMPGYGEI